MIAIRVNGVVGFDGWNDVIEQVLFEGGECWCGGEDVAFCAVILLCSPVRHNHDHGCGLFCGEEVVEQVCGVGKSLPFGFVTADAVEQVEDGVFFFG